MSRKRRAEEVATVAVLLLKVIKKGGYRMFAVDLLDFLAEVCAYYPEVPAPNFSVSVDVAWNLNRHRAVGKPVVWDRVAWKNGFSGYGVGAEGNIN